MLFGTLFFVELIGGIILLPLALVIGARVAKLTRVDKKGAVVGLGFWRAFSYIFIAGLIAGFFSLPGIAGALVQFAIFFIALIPGLRTFKPTPKQYAIVYGIFTGIYIVFVGIIALLTLNA